MPVKPIYRHRRMWINQPSTLQPDHSQHGRFVITDETYSGKFVMCLYLNGDAYSGFVSRLSLSPGWPAYYANNPINALEGAGPC
jgi:hypothetical protein